MESEPKLSPILRKGFTLTALVNLMIGAGFLFGPELHVTLWPSPISPVLTRFIGAIIMANGVGAWMVGRAGTWAEARPLTFVGLVYGYLVLLSVIPQLLSSDVDNSLWGYVAFTLVFIGPLTLIVYRYEAARRGSGSNKPTST